LQVSSCSAKRRRRKRQEKEGKTERKKKRKGIKICSKQETTTEGLIT